MVGPGLDPKSNIGPVTSELQLNRVLDYIESGKKEGATVAIGGIRLTEGELGKGFFIAPTVFVDVENDMRIVQEEIFGPVVTVQKFKTEEEAIKLANSTKYGLAGAVFSGDGTKALRVIKKFARALLGSMIITQPLLKRLGGVINRVVSALALEHTV